MLVGAIFYLEALKNSIKPMEMEVNIGPDKEVVVRTSGKVNKLIGLDAQQGWRVHA